MAEPLRVVLRLRPDEAGSGEASCVAVGVGGTVEVLPGPRESTAQLDGTPLSKARPRLFQFDRVFGPGATQCEVYSVVDPLVCSAVQGYNATVFAYGSTGSGKTHTISGSGAGADALHEAQGGEEAAGVIPRAVARIFELARELTERERETLVFVLKHRLRGAIQQPVPRPVGAGRPRRRVRL